MYLTLAELKAKRGITDNTQDVALQQLLDESSALLVSMGYDFTSQTRRKLISMCDFAGDALYLDHVNVTSLDSIDGMAYTGVLDTDYFIDAPKQSKLVFLTRFTRPSKSRFLVEYTAGYGTIPDDLKLAQEYLIKTIETATNATPGTGAIKKIKLGPKEITYDTGATEEVESSALTFQSILSGYSLPILTSF